MAAEPVEPDQSTDTNEYNTDTDVVHIRRAATYTIPRKDLADNVYRWELEKSQRKPSVIATARLLRISELVIQPAIPGVSLGTELISFKHLAGAVRGSEVTVTAVCTRRHGPDWYWNVEVREANASQELIAVAVVKFTANIDPERYQRRVTAKLAVRPARTVWWLRFLDALWLALVMVSPAGVAYAWNAGLVSQVATVTISLAVWWILLTGRATQIRDWLTVRRVKDKDIPVQLDSIGDEHYGTDAYTDDAAPRAPGR